MTTILSMVRAGFASSLTRANSSAAKIASASSTSSSTTAQSTKSYPAMTGKESTKALRASLIAAATGTAAMTAQSSGTQGGTADVANALLDQSGALYNFRANAKVLSVLNTQASTISFLA
jgi:hypothetical protein